MQIVTAVEKFTFWGFMSLFFFDFCKGRIYPTEVMHYQIWINFLLNRVCFLDELFDIDGGHLYTTTIKESDGSTTIIYTDSQGNCLSVRNITPSC